MACYLGVGRAANPGEKKPRPEERALHPPASQNPVINLPNKLLTPHQLSALTKHFVPTCKRNLFFSFFLFFELKVGLFRFFRKIRLKHMFGNSDIQYKGLIHLCLSLKAHSYLTPQIPLSKHCAEWLSKKLLKDNPSHSLCLKTNPTFDFQKKVSEATGAALCSV